MVYVYKQRINTNLHWIVFIVVYITGGFVKMNVTLGMYMSQRDYEAKDHINATHTVTYIRHIPHT